MGNNTEPAGDHRHRTNNNVTNAQQTIRIFSSNFGGAFGMNVSKYDLVVFGTGPAGQKGAIAAAKSSLEFQDQSGVYAEAGRGSPSLNFGLSQTGRDFNAGANCV